MNFRWVLPFLVVLLSILTISMVFLSRRPLCIESRVVERIDRGSESIFQCIKNHHVPYSSYFGEHLFRIEVRIQQVEMFLQKISPLRARLRIVILPENTNQFVVDGSTLFISEKLLEARGHLEKALLKKWYRENAQNLFAYDNLFEEIFTDFMLFLIKGSLKIEDPFRGVQTKLNGSRWPQVIKSSQAYCRSPWKRSEHYLWCADANASRGVKDNEILELSVRPLIVSSWVEAYKALSFKDQYQFVLLAKELISTDHSPELPLVRTGGIIPDSNPLAEASEAIKNINYFLTSSNLTQYSDSHRFFVTLVANNLGRFGFKEGFGGAHFDLLYVSDQSVQNSSGIFKHLQSLSKKNPKVKMAIKDRDQLWMLPSVYPIPWRSLETLRADRTVYGRCGHYDFNLVWSFANLTDKLMIVNNCGDKKINLTRYIDDGAEGFGTQNENVGFIQFHLPSLLMRKDALAQVNSVYDLISHRQIDSPVFQSLGWREIKYSEKAGAYKPKSAVDGIEWFKVQ